MDEPSYKNKCLVAAYNRLFDRLLDPQKISHMGIFESFDFSSVTITAKPAVIEPILRNETLPSLFFLLCSN